MKARLGLVLVLAGASGAWGQSAISAHSGMIHYVEGKVLLDGQAIDPKFGEFPEVKNDQVLETGEGRAEVLLTPGVFLRLAENSSFKMLSNRLSDTALEALTGSAMFEVDELLKDNAITVRYKDATVALSKEGLYRVDSDPARVRVYAGDAEVIFNGKTVQAHKGHQVALDETMVATSFDSKDTDSFYRWASRRSEYVAAANVSSARSAGCSGFASSTSTPCNGNYGSYGTPYGTPYGSWAWNPYFGMFTYLPGLGYGYNPFGWAFYSPYTVGALYIPGYYGGWGYAGAPVYTNNGTGPTALSGARQSPATLASSSGSAPLRGVSPSASNGNFSNGPAGPSAPAGNAGNGGGGGSVSAPAAGGGSAGVGGGSLGGARSSGGGGHR